MVRARQLPSRDFLIFVGVYILVDAVFSFGLSQFVQFLGVTRQAAASVVTDNELSLQSFSTLIALLAVFKFNGKGSLAAFVKQLFPRSPLTTDALSNLISGGVLRGFWLASFCVAASIFLGFVTVEWPRWDFMSIWRLLPILVLQILGSLLWVVLFDRSFAFLWDCLVVRSKKGLEARLLIIALGSRQLFTLLNVSPHFFDQFFVGLVCALIAAGYLLWLEAGPALYGSKEKASLIRTSLVAGFLLSLAHVYGQVIGGSHALSLMNIFDGPLPAPFGSLASSAIVGNCLVVLTLIVLVNLLLQRVLKKFEDLPSAN